MSDQGRQSEDLKSSTIMLVDDEPTVIEVLQVFLEDYGYSRFVSTTDSTTAMALAAESRPDVLLLDLKMPHVDGLEILSAIRSSDDLKHIPVILLTASEDEDTKRRALGLGATDFLTKPADPSELALRLRNALAAKANQDRLTHLFEEFERPETPARPKREDAPVVARLEAKVAELTAELDRMRSAAVQPRRVDIETPVEAHKDATILLVDDEETTIDVVQAFLEQQGYNRFVRTTNPHQALDLISKHEPDVVLLDLNMPGVGGLEILASIRKDEALKRMPVLILTASTDVGAKLEALELGASDFLSKPVDSSELALRLRNTLAAKAYQDRLADTDALTGLPNRRRFLQLLEQSLERASRESAPCSVLEIDLDRFKQINDTLGHGAGDALLKAVAGRIQSGAKGLLSRLGGDEFSLILPGVGDAESASRVAQAIVDELDEPFCVDGQDLFVACSIGIAVFPKDGDNMETLLKHANVAMSFAKRGGQAPYQFYHESLNAQAEERLHLESALRGALYCDEMALHFQPQVDLASGRIVAAEALMRWKHPELGLLPAAEFLPLAQGTDLIRSLGDWALQEACRQARKWLDSGHPDIRMCVNVATGQFRAGTLVETIRAALGDSGLTGACLTLELSEGHLLENPQKTASTLAELRDLGVKIVIDGFGTGHSSLADLKRLPVDELKIHGSLIAGVIENDADAAIVSAIIGLAHSLGLTVVAEAVETEDQLAFLASRGCDGYQGRLFSRPVPPGDWAALLEDPAVS